MGMSSALNAGVTGLAVNTSRLAAISDNIANSATFGYKRAEVDFSSVVIGSAQGQFDAGGVRSTSQREVDARGSLVTTTNATDLAITGRGLLPVTTVAQRDETVDTRPLQLVSTGSFTLDDEGFLRTSSGLQLLGWDAPGGVVNPGITRASGADLVPVQIDGFNFASNPTTRIDVGVNLPSTADHTTTPAPTFTTGIEYFDSLGAARVLTVEFTKTGADQWRLRFADNQTGLALAGLEATVTFHPDATPGEAGSIASIAIGTGTATVGTGTTTLTYPNAGSTQDGVLQLALDNGTVQQTLNLDLGDEDIIGNLTQFASGFAPVALTTDGNPVGALSRLEVTERGFVDAIYDSGFRTTLYQIPVADVPNLNGLEAVDNQAFTVSTSSGNIYFYDAGQGPTGNMLGFALEQSTTDIAAELTQLIETQRAYSSNATIVRTVDEMLQETTNLKR